MFTASGNFNFKLKFTCQCSYYYSKLFSSSTSWPTTGTISGSRATATDCQWQPEARAAGQPCELSASAEMPRCDSEGFKFLREDHWQPSGSAARRARDHWHPPRGPILKSSRALAPLKRLKRRKGIFTSSKIHEGFSKV